MQYVGWGRGEARTGLRLYRDHTRGKKARNSERGTLTHKIAVSRLRARVQQGATGDEPWPYRKKRRLPTFRAPLGAESWQASCQRD